LTDKADLFSGFFWLVFSAFVSYQSYELGLGTLHQPGPGFLFFWTGISTGFLAGAIIMMSLRKGPADNAKQLISERKSPTKIILVLASLFLYAWLMELLGFIIVTMLLFLFLLGIVEKKRWRFAVLVSLIVTASSYLVFELGLQSQLPKGLLGYL
jgi:putative tricarboxylic transport membrane protein